MTPPGARALIFDLDDTLHSTKELARAYVELAAVVLSRHIGVPPDVAAQRIRERQEELTLADSEGRRPTMSRTLESYGITLRDWVDARDREIQPGPYVRPDARLRAQLERLGRHFILAILTNNSRLHAEAITEALGIRDLFGERIFTVSDSLVLKPDPSVFQRAAASLGIPPERCVSIGDRPAVDLEPARAIGMHGIAVESPDALYAVLDALLAGAEA